MSELHRHKLKLSDGQKRKLRIAYKKRRSAVVGLTSDNLTGGRDHILLTEVQHKALNKAMKNKTGLRVALSYDQLMENKKGGLLKEVLEFVEKTVPGGKRFISPLVRQQLAPMLKNQFLPWLTGLIDNEIDTIMEKDPKGSGLKQIINRKLDSLLHGSVKKKITH